MSEYDEISKDGLEDMLDDRDAEIERLTTEDARKADVISHLDSEIERLRGWINVSGGLPCPNTQCHDTGGFPVDDGYGGCEEQQCEFCWTCDESIFMRARVSSSQEPT